jgi:hypothetical protein
VTFPELAVASAVMAVGATVQGSIGFGLNVVAAPILLIVDPVFVPGPALAMALVITALIALRDRRHIDLGGMGWALVGRVPASLAGAALVAVLSQRDLTIAFAVLVLGGVALSAAGWELRPTPPTLVGAGALSGLMGTVSSIGGPPMALVYQRRSGGELRGTLAGFFLPAATLSLGLLAAVGAFGKRELLASGALLPGLVIGFVASRWTAPYLDRGSTRPAVLGLSALAAVGAVLRYTI